MRGLLLVLLSVYSQAGQRSFSHKRQSRQMCLAAVLLLTRAKLLSQMGFARPESDPHLVWVLLDWNGTINGMRRSHLICWGDPTHENLYVLCLQDLSPLCITCRENISQHAFATIFSLPPHAHPVFLLSSEILIQEVWEGRCRKTPVIGMEIGIDLSNLKQKTSNIRVLKGLLSAFSWASYEWDPSWICQLGSLGLLVNSGCCANPGLW